MSWKDRATPVAPAAQSSDGGWKARAVPVEEEPGLLESAGRAVLENVVVPVGRAIDTYTGAPTRAAAQIGIKGGGLSEMLGAFGKQFGEAPELAPTGKELAQQVGVSDTAVSDVAPGLYSETGDEWLKLKRGGLLDPTASGAAGLGADIVLDPTNVIPFGLIAKQGAKAGKGLKGLVTASKAADTAGDVSKAVTATRAAAKPGIIQGAVDVAKRTADTISSIATPKRVENYEKLAATAKKLGIDPNDLSATAEFGQGATVSRLERSVREGSMGGELMSKFENVASRLSDGVDETLMKLGGGPVPDALGAGEALKSGYSAAEKALLESADLTYKSASRLTPQMRLTPDAAKSLQTAVNGIEKRAIGLIKRGATGDQQKIGRDLIGLTQRLKKSGDNYKQLSEQINFIGQAMSDPALNRLQAKELRNLYGTLSDSLIKTVGDIHPDLGKQLVENNKRMTEFFSARDALGQAIQSSKSNPETLFRSLASDAVKIEQLKKIMPDQFNQFRASYLGSLVKRNAEGQVLWDSTIKSIRANKGRLSKMFDPEEIEELADILDLGSRQGVAVLSTSGTAPSNAFSNIKNNIVDSIFNEQVLNRMKARGRNAIKDAEQVIGPAAQPPGGLNELIRPKQFTEATFSLSDLLKSVPVKKSLKGAQSVAPGQYNRE